MATMTESEATSTVVCEGVGQEARIGSRRECAVCTDAIDTNAGAFRVFGVGVVCVDCYTANEGYLQKHDLGGDGIGA